MKITSIFTRVLLAAVFAVLAFMPLAGYALEVEITADEDVPKATLVRLQGYVAKVESFYQEHYGMDVDYPIKLVVTSTKESYISAIGNEFGYSREIVEKTHAESIGVTLGHKIIMNIEGSTSALEFKTLAHELSHQYHLSLGGSSNQLYWMGEGIADVLAAGILSVNGIGTLDSYEKNRLAVLRSAGNVPDLSSLRTSADWRNQASKTGMGINYYTAETAAMFLVRKVGFAPLFDYFKIVGKTGYRTKAFYEAFGITLEDFEEEFRGYLAEQGINN